MKKNTRPTIASLSKQVEELKKQLNDKADERWRDLQHKMNISLSAATFKARMDNVDRKLDKLLLLPALQVEAKQNWPTVKAGDLVAVCDDYQGASLERGKVYLVNEVNEGLFIRVDGIAWVPTVFRHPTMAEIQAYREAEEARRWEGKTCFEGREACECTPEQLQTLKSIGAGLLYNDLSNSPNIRWDTDYKDPLVITSTSGQWNNDSPMNWLPYPVFLRCLENEVAARKAKEIEEEKSNPLRDAIEQIVGVKDKLVRL